MIDLKDSEPPEPESSEEENRVREQRFQEYRRYVHRLPSGTEPIGYFEFLESLERKDTEK